MRRGQVIEKEGVSLRGWVVNEKGFISFAARGGRGAEPCRADDVAIARQTEDARRFSYREAA